jgi:hypothetical protein
LRRDAFELRLAARRNHDACATLRESGRDRLSNSARGTGHEGISEGHEPTIYQAAGHERAFSMPISQPARSRRSSVKVRE